MATKEVVDLIVTLAAEITGRDLREVIRNSKWGEYNFDDCLDDLERAYEVIRPLPALPLESLLQARAGEINAALKGLGASINAAMEFTIKQDDPERRRGQLASKLTSEAQGAWNQIAPWIGYLYIQAGDVSEGLKKIAESRENVDNALVEFLSRADEGQAQIKAATNAAKDAAGKAGVGYFTEDFATAASNHRNAALRWLWATGGFAILTGVAAWVFWFLFSTPVVSDMPALVQLILFKIIILGLLFTGTVWCGRLYKTAKHQEAVNDHRANALKTFQAFVEASKDPAVQDAVLMETTRSIFAITPSGYLVEGDTRSDSGSRVVEVVKAASKAATRDEG